MFRRQLNLYTNTVSSVNPVQSGIQFDDTVGIAKSITLNYVQVLDWLSRMLKMGSGVTISYTGRSDNNSISEILDISRCNMSVDVTWTVSTTCLGNSDTRVLARCIDEKHVIGLVLRRLDKLNQCVFGTAGFCGKALLETYPEVLY